MEKTVTFEQARPLLYFWANYYQNREYDFWDLVNSAWAYGGVRNLTNIKFASRRIKYDMLGYMRQDRGVRRVKRQKTYSFSEIGKNTVNNSSLINWILGDINKNKVESEDFIEWLLRGLSRREKLLIKMRYFGGMNWIDVSKAIGGITKSRASQMHKEILGKLKERFAA